MAGPARWPAAGHVEEDGIAACTDDDREEAYFEGARLSFSTADRSEHSACLHIDPQAWFLTKRRHGVFGRLI